MGNTTLRKKMKNTRGKHYIYWQKEHTKQREQKMQSLSDGGMSGMFEEPKRGQYYCRQMNDRGIVGDIIR